METVKYRQLYVLRIMSEIPTRAFTGRGYYCLYIRYAVPAVCNKYGQKAGRRAPVVLVPSLICPV